jgi:hypothetical protein
MLFIIILFYVTLYYSRLIIHYFILPYAVFYYSTFSGVILYVHILICDEIRENSELVVGSVEQDSRILFNDNY